MTKSLTEVPDSIAPVAAPLPSIPVIPSMPVGVKAHDDPSGSDTATINMARELATL
jgi:hypothetical protein